MDVHDNGCTELPVHRLAGFDGAGDHHGERYSAIELGVKFRSTIDGFITGIRFYKGPQNTGVHVGNLWTSTGTLLSTATFTGETASGWQQVTLPQPVAVNANTVYVASYHTTTGFYSADGAYFAASTVSGPLEALADGASGGNGVYLPGAGGFPTNTFNSTNYWVDVVFVQTAPAPPPSISRLRMHPSSKAMLESRTRYSMSACRRRAVGQSPWTSRLRAARRRLERITQRRLVSCRSHRASRHATITVPVTGDTTSEGNETFLVTLSNPNGASIARGQATGTITDDDQPGISIGNATVIEGNSGTVNAVLTLTLSPASTQTVTVGYATGNGSATAPADYTAPAAGSSVSFGPGITTAQITVPVEGDTLDEADETFSVNLSSPVNATLLNSTGTVTITDNDGPPSMTIADVTRAEGNVNAVFTVTLSVASGQIVTVAYATADGTATAPAEYTARSGTVSFNPGIRTAQINVPIIGDTRDEPNETFFVNLSNATGATIADDQATGTITDNDNPPAIRISNVTVTEPNTAAPWTLFSTSRCPRPVSSQSRSITRLPMGRLLAVADYVATSGTLSFAPLASSAQVTVQVLGDVLDEVNETVRGQSQRRNQRDHQRCAGRWHHHRQRCDAQFENQRCDHK